MTRVEGRGLVIRGAVKSVLEGLDDESKVDLKSPGTIMK